MVSARIHNAFVVNLLSIDPILRDSLEWIRNEAETADFRNYELGKPGWYANVHSYQTLPERDCIWENHRHTVDVQYMIAGAECIRWTDVSELGSPTKIIRELDREEFAPPASAKSTVNLETGRFVLFLPGEAHCPKIQLFKQETIRKVVVKIPFELLTTKPTLEGTHET